MRVAGSTPPTAAAVRRSCWPPAGAPSAAASTLTIPEILFEAAAAAGLALDDAASGQPATAAAT